jgi:hypothetical protein
MSAWIEQCEARVLREVCTRNFAEVGGIIDGEDTGIEGEDSEAGKRDIVGGIAKDRARRNSLKEEAPEMTGVKPQADSQAAKLAKKKPLITTTVVTSYTCDPLSRLT